MTPDEFVQAVNEELRGIDDDAPTDGTDEYDYWLNIASRLRRSNYNDASKQWAATWEIKDLGVVTAGASVSFTPATKLINPSNDAYVIDTDGHKHPFSVVKPQDKSASTQQIYTAGAPKKVYFTQPVDADDQITGGHLWMPGYWMPGNITSETPTIIVDDDDWLILATAAKIAFGDVTYEDKVADLNAMANAQFKVMARNNMRGNTDSARGGKIYSRNKIGSPNRSGLGRR